MKKHLVSSIQKEDLLSSFINEVPFGVIITDHSGVVIELNRSAIHFINAEQQAIIGQSILQFLVCYPDLFEALETSYSNHCKSFIIDSVLYNSKYYKLSGKTMLDGYIVTIEDITTQKEIEHTSIQAILESQELERRRIGREIHDGLGPLLSTIKLSLDSLKDDLSEKHNLEAIKSIETITTTIDNITIDLRSISQRLVPRLLEEFGIFVAFENLIFKINETKRFTIKFYCNFDKQSRFDSEIELNLFRCGQELINNAVKYSHAKSILVQVILHSNSIVLMVEDDGDGFIIDEILPENGGIGLTNIETRVRMLHGEFFIDSHTGKGTVASIEIPII